MDFVFPKDEELFQDLDSVSVDDYGSMQVLVDRAVKKIYEEERFGVCFREKAEKLRSEDISVSAKGSSEYEAAKNVEEKLHRRFREDFRKMEEIADRFSGRNRIGSFPKSRIYKRSFIWQSDNEEEEYSVDYFEELNQATGFLVGPGHVGSFMARAKTELDAAKQKQSLISGIGLFILLLGVILVLAGVRFFYMLHYYDIIPAVDFLPTIVADLMDESLLVRIIVLALMALTGGFLAMMGPPFAEEKGHWLAKFFTNGIFLFIVGIGSVLCAMREVFSDAELDPFSVLPFGIYFIIYSIFPIIGQIALHFDAKKAARKAKKDFCGLVENNIQHMHRYIRFHTLWWKKQYPNSALPSCINNLQKSFDHLLKMYKKYN